MKFHVDLHARVEGEISVRDGHDIAHLLKDTLRKELPELGHVLIHIEPK
jgi:divalent metal cation (Fe/Co/Zn/Cd) transporter